MKIYRYTMFALWFGTSTGHADDLTKRLQQTLEQIRAAQIETNRHLPDAEKDLIPGITAAIVFRDGREFQISSGWRDEEARLPMLPTSRMLGGSTGKLFAGALATQLIFEGKLALDQRVAASCGNARWLARLANRDNMTLRHLLNHSSGLGSYFATPEFYETMRLKFDPDSATYDPFYRPRFGDLMQFIEPEGALFPAGTQQSYSENGYLLVGYIIGQQASGSNDEEVIQRAYFRELTRRVLHKLNLTQTEPNTGVFFANMAQGYFGTHPLIPFPMFAKTALLDRDGFLTLEFGHEFSGGGLVTSSRDLAHFLLHAVEGDFYERPEQRRDFKQLYLTRGPSDEYGQYYGLSPQVGDLPGVGRIFNHQGFAPGYLSAVHYFENLGVSIAVQVNSSQNRRLLPYTMAILRSLQSDAIAQ